MRPVCVACNLECHCHKNGVALLVMIEDGGGKKAPYQLWHGDQWKCPSCGITFVSGYGTKPISDSSDPKFSEWVAAEETVVKVYA